MTPEEKVKALEKLGILYAGMLILSVSITSMVFPRFAGSVFVGLQLGFVCMVFIITYVFGDGE